MPIPPKRQLRPCEIAARRRNARKCTGPRTAAGKRRSALNSLKWAICSAWLEEEITKSGGDPGQFRRLYRHLIALLQPCDAYTEQVVGHLALNWWEKLKKLRLAAGRGWCAWEVTSVNNRIEGGLAAWLRAIQLRTRKWRDQIRKAAGREVAELPDLREAIEARLEAFQALVLLFVITMTYRFASCGDG